MKLEDAHHKHFQAVVGKKLSINAEGVDSIELTSVEAKPSHEGTEREPFVLTFSGPADVVLPQSIYAIKHKKLGRLKVFMVPVGQDKDQVTYEAIFN